MKLRTQRLLIGSIFPIVLSCSTFVVLFMFGRNNLSVLPETIGTVFVFGFLIMGLPTFVVSIVAESRNNKISSNNKFYKVGGLAGFMCSLVPSLVNQTILGVLIFSTIGVFVGLCTAIILRWHFNTFTANQHLHRTP